MPNSSLIASGGSLDNLIDKYGININDVMCYPSKIWSMMHVKTRRKKGARGCLYVYVYILKTSITVCHCIFDDSPLDITVYSSGLPCSAQEAVLRYIYFSWHQLISNTDSTVAVSMDLKTVILYQFDQSWLQYDTRTV